jgi:capsular polysaccharide transport system ATP-binding protein
MIRLNGLHKSYAVGDQRRVVLDEVSAELPRGRSVGLLGVNGAGKSTLLRLIAGTELPDKGHVVRDGRVSWPLGFSGSFHGSTTGRANVHFIARIYGKDVDDTVAFVDDFAELGHYIDMPVKTYSSGMRSRLAFAVSMSMEFDTYLVDEITAVGDARFQARCSQVFRQRRGAADLIMASHNIATIREYCDMGALVSDGRLTVFDRVDDAITSYEERLKAS